MQSGPARAAVFAACCDCVNLLTMSGVLESGPWSKKRRTPRKDRDQCDGEIDPQPYISRASNPARHRGCRAHGYSLNCRSGAIPFWLVDIGCSRASILDFSSAKMASLDIDWVLPIPVEIITGADPPGRSCPEAGCATSGLPPVVAARSQSRHIGQTRPRDRPYRRRIRAERGRRTCLLYTSDAADE